MQIVRHTFNKEERLKSKTLIDHLFKEGKVFHQYPYKVIYEFTENQEFKLPAKMGVSVSKRLFTKAVERNHIKRKIREAYRINKNNLYLTLSENDQKVYFFVIYTAKQNLSFNEIEKSMKELIFKLQKHISKS